jgi:hypothetical protein
VIQLPVQYLSTVAMFLFRPRSFFASRDSDRSTFVGPSAFLVANIALSGSAAVLAVKLFAENRPAPSRLDFAVVFAGVALFHCGIAIGIGKIAGLLLNERTDAAELLSAFCYTSIFYVPLATIIALGPLSLSDYDAATTIAGSIVQILALVYLLWGMGYASSLYGRRLLAFATVTGTITALCISGLTVIVILYHPSWIGPPVSQEAKVRMESGIPVGAITVGFRGATSTSVQLIGAPISAITAE